MRTMEVLERVLRAKRLRPSSVVQYKYALSLLAEFSPEWPESAVVIDEWIASLRGYADTTLRNFFAYVNSAGKYLERVYNISNPCNGASRVKVEKRRRRYYTAEELVSIIKACRNEQDRALIAVLIDSACRIGELVGIKASNVGVSWLDVKGKTGERRYRLAPEICERLKVMGEGGQPIFKNRAGGCANEVQLKMRVRRIVDRAGITGKKRGPHTIRHTSASMVARETKSALVVKALLQHDNIDTSMLYIHDVESEIAQGVSPLALLGQSFVNEGGGGEYVQAMLPEGEFIEVDDGDGSNTLVPVSDSNGAHVLESGMFPEIVEGQAVRPLLKNEDLRLLRRVFIEYALTHRDGDVVRSSELLKRMVRRSKAGV